jgi:Tfp pilus assembly protein PilN
VVIINLLPWREYARQYQSRVIRKTIFSMIVIVMSLMLGLHYSLTLLKTNLSAEVKHFQIECQGLTENKLPQPTVTRFSEYQINALSTYRRDSETLFFLLSSRAPKGVCFNTIKRIGEMMFFSGRTHSMGDLAEFLTWCKRTQLFTEIKIHTLKRVESEPWLHFSLQTILMHPLPMTEKGKDKNGL